MNTVERLRIELEKAEENLEQQKFFVEWLKSNISFEEIKQTIKSVEKK